MSNLSTASIEKLVCTECKGTLLPSPGMLICSCCGRENPVRDQIPDFLYSAHKGQHYSNWIRLPEKVHSRAMAWIVENPSRVSDIALELWWQLFARMYESSHGIRRAIAGAAKGTQSVEAIFEWMLSRVRADSGLVLDAASGPSTLGRRLAGRQGVFAIDIVLPMLKRGASLAAMERTHNIQFVRAKVEALPFLDGTFAGALLGQALHWLTDPVAGLSELASVLRPGSVLSGGTALKGGSSELSRASAHTGGHPFDVEELRRCLLAGGFVDVELESAGEVLLFAARRRD